MLPPPSAGDSILETALPLKRAQPQPPPNNPPNLPSALTYADCVHRTTKSVDGNALRSRETVPSNWASGMTGHPLSQCRQRLKGSAKSMIDPFATPSPTGRKRCRPRSRSRTPPIDTSPADKEPPSERKERAPGQVELLLSAPSPSTTLTQCHNTTSPKERSTPKSVEDHPPHSTTSHSIIRDCSGEGRENSAKVQLCSSVPTPKDGTQGG